jgi:glycosyltransferase involved in cell wall biosynthesis
MSVPTPPRDLGASKIAVLQVVVPDYRVSFFDLLFARLESNLEILAGCEDFDPSVRPAGAFADSKRLRNHFLAGRRLLWQAGSLRSLLQADVAVMTLNPRILNVWAILVLRRILGKRTVLWGHAWPRAGQGSGTDRIRHLMRALADGFIVYTETQARELQQRMTGAQILAAPNALFKAVDLAPTSSSRSPTNFVCVGRLIGTKKPDLLLRAFLLAREQLSHQCQLIFVGDGPLRLRLEREVAKAEATARVRFRGHVSGVGDLRAIYADALASVSPGYVGLNLIQSLGFGVPMLIARDEPHSPEIEAAVDGTNALFFSSDSETALASLMITAFRTRESWLSRRRAIADTCSRTYTVDLMVSRFLQMFYVVLRDHHQSRLWRSRGEKR